MLNKKMLSFLVIAMLFPSLSVFANENIYIGSVPNKINSVTNKPPAVNPVNNNANNQTKRIISSPNNVKVKGGKACFEEAAKYHNVDPWLLMSIAYVESGFNPKAKNTNKNGSYDTGLMQINSIWLPVLKEKGIDSSALSDPCASAYIGAWILSTNIKKFGYNWRAIGAYNSRNYEIGYKYAKKVYAAHEKFTGIKSVVPN